MEGLCNHHLAHLPFLKWWLDAHLNILSYEQNSSLKAAIGCMFLILVQACRSSTRKDESLLQTSNPQKRASRNNQLELDLVYTSGRFLHFHR